MSVGCSVISHFIPDFGNVPILIFFIVTTARSFSNLSIFSKNPLLFQWFSLLFVFNFCAFSLFYFLLFPLGLFCSSSLFEMATKVIESRLFFVQMPWLGLLLCLGSQECGAGIPGVCSSSSMEASSPPAFLFHLSDSSMLGPHVISRGQACSEPGEQEEMSPHILLWTSLGLLFSLWSFTGAQTIAITSGASRMSELGIFQCAKAENRF